MTEQADLFTGVRRMFWGFFFLLLDFNLNLNSVTIPLLPDVLGWFFLFRGIDALSPARPSLELLKTRSVSCWGCAPSPSSSPLWRSCPPGGCPCSWPW